MVSECWLFIAANVWIVVCIVGFMEGLWRANGLVLGNWVGLDMGLVEIGCDFMKIGINFYGMDKYGVCWEIVWEWRGEYIRFIKIE